MAGSKLKYWDSITDEDYSGMVKRHEPLWDYVTGFILASNTRSILEIGAGKCSPVKKLVPVYKAIDLNGNTEAIHADFTLISTKLFPRYDMLLACAVIEHCDGYYPFFCQVRNYNAPWSLISFFNDVRRPKDYIRLGGKGVLNNKYSATRMIECLKFLELEFKWVRLTRRSVILIIKGK